MRYALPSDVAESIAGCDRGWRASASSILAATAFAVRAGRFVMRIEAVAFLSGIGGGRGGYWEDVG